MAIDNITRNNTIDEWRIQTNQSANALNTLETGDYTKSNGTLTLNANSSLIITSNGTALQVSNTVLFQTRLEVGNTIALGVREAGTGNLSVGNTVFIFGSGNALFVANNATVNNNLQVTNTVTTNNVGANNNITVGRNLLMTNTGNVIFANTGAANIQTIYVTDEYARNIYTNIVDVTNYINIGANGTIGTTLDVTGNTTVGNLNTSGVANSQTLQVNTSGTIGTTLTVTGNTTVGNLNTSGVANSQTLRVNTSGTIGTTLTVGTTLDVTGNTTVGNLNTSGVANSQTLRVNTSGTIGTTLTVGTTLDVTGNTTVGNLNTSGVANSQTLRVNTSGTIGTTLTVTGNTTVGNLNTSGVANSQTLRVGTSGTIGTTLTVGTTLNVTGNTTVGNLNTSGTLITTGSATIGGPLLVQNTATIQSDFAVQGDLEVNGDFNISGNVVYDTDSLIISAAAPKDAGFATFGVFRTGANAEIRWSAPVNEWQIRDVDNSNSYSKILTANLISDSLISISSSTVASSNAANLLNIAIVSANTAMKSYVDSRTTSNITEGANLYLTAARVRGNVTNTAPINYDISTGTFSHATSGVAASGYGDSVNVATLVVNTFGHVTSVTNTAIRTGTTAVTGIVLLQDSVTSTSTTNAATSNSVKTAYDLALTKLNSSGGTLSGDLVVTGNLTISGQTTYANTQTLLIGDNIITLNADLPISVAASENAGIEVNRGSNSNVYLRWDEGIDTWVANNGTNLGEYRVANTTTYLTEGTNLYLTAARVRSNISLTTGSAAYNSTTGVITVPGTTSHLTEGTNLYFTTARVRSNISLTTGSAAYNSTTGVITVPGTTSHLTEGTNLYFTTARVRGNVTNTAPINYDSSNGIFSHATSGVAASGYGDSVNVATLVVNTFGHVTSVTNTAIRAANTTLPGIVKLDDTISSTSNTTAATANTVKTAYDLANSKLSSITITNGTGISGGGTGSSFTLSIGQAVATTSDVQFRSIGVGTTPDTSNTGSIRATGDITAFFSDERLKEDITLISDPITKINMLRGVHYVPNDVAVSYGYSKDKKVGVIAQDIEQVLPEIVVPAPFDIDENGNSISGENYKTVQYDKIIPLLIEAIKELSVQVEDLKSKINK
jgi:hypothetical protein